MGNYGIRISKNGTDVKTGNDRDMVLTSKYPLLKGKLSGGGSVNVTSGTISTITINHALGYIPFITIYFKNAAFGNVWYLTPFNADAGAETLYVSSKADANNAYIKFDWWINSGGVETFLYKYFIFLDKGKL